MNSFTWTLKKIGYRTYQAVFKLALKAMNFPGQKLITGAGTLLQIPQILKDKNISSVLIVNSKSVRNSGMLDGLFLELKKQNIDYTIFQDVQANPTTHNADQGFKAYTENNCQAIVAIGGGSPLDCAKIIGVKAGNPKLSYEKMKNMTNIKKPMPLFIAVPTTAGTGSESTVCAVLSNPDNHTKYPVVTMHMMPDYAILDETLMKNLPASVTAATGMDALTHAVEAYIGNFGTKYTNSEALIAIKMIFENLEKAVSDSDNLEYKKNMLIASNHAANAFTRAYTGYVHTISHALSALYNVGHGKTNATVLPYVLRYYGKSIEKKLATIARYCSPCSLDETNQELAESVITRIENLNKQFGIPSKIPELKKEDTDQIINRALKEGNPANPVPKLMNEENAKSIIDQLLV